MMMPRKSGRFGSIVAPFLSSHGDLRRREATLVPNWWNALPPSPFLLPPHRIIRVPAKTLHTWHPFENPRTPENGEKEHSPGAFRPPGSVTAVLLGWLGSQEKHLKRYADWYDSQGIGSVTFVIPMKDILSLKAAPNVENHIDILARELKAWLAADSLHKKEKKEERCLIFHMFSNTGWLTYGVILEKLMNGGTNFLGNIKGCVVDSAPAAEPDPKVWALGFSASLFKKRSFLSQAPLKMVTESNGEPISYPQPDLVEAAFIFTLKKGFSAFLQLPSVKRRLNDVISILYNRQPPCPQLYMYSTVDIIIRSTLVEAFMEDQRKAGRIVKGCNFQSSPHVDHFRAFPDLYGEQLLHFLRICFPQEHVT